MHVYMVSRVVCSSIEFYPESLSYFNREPLAPGTTGPMVPCALYVSRMPYRYIVMDAVKTEDSCLRRATSGNRCNAPFNCIDLGTHHFFHPSLTCKMTHALVAH